MDDDPDSWGSRQWQRAARRQIRPGSRSRTRGGGTAARLVQLTRPGVVPSREESRGGACEAAAARLAVGHGHPGEDDGAR